MTTKSLVNLGLVKTDLRRFWPLWLAYLVALAFVFVIPMSALIAPIGAEADPDYTLNGIRTAWRIAYGECLPIAFVGSLIVALSLNDRLFNKKAATFYGSLPLNRTCVFASSYLAGLIGLFAVPALVACALAGFQVFGPNIGPSMIGEWLLFLLALTFVFYSIAQLACMLSGTRYAAVLICFVMNLLAVCLERAVQLVTSALRYGMTDWNSAFDWASPLVGLMNHGIAGALIVLGHVNWTVVGGYCTFALVLTIGTAMLEGRRDYEMAGEAVAFPRLRVVLKYLAGVSMGLLFGAIACIFLWWSNVEGPSLSYPGAFALFALMAIGSFLGLLFAEMTMQRSTRALGTCWKGGIVLACLSLLLVGCCLFDVFDVESRVPSPDDVAQAQIRADYEDLGEYSSEEGVASVVDLHRALLDYGKSPEAEAANSGGFGIFAARPGDTAKSVLTIRYTLKNGGAFERTYPVFYAQDTVDEGGTMRPEEPSIGAKLLQRAADLGNSEEGLRSRFASVLGATEGDGVEIIINFVAADNELSVTLADDQKAGFVAEALAPDILEGHAEDYEPWGSMLEDGKGAYVEVLDREGAQLMYLWLDGKKTPSTIAWVKEHYPDYKIG